MQIIDNKINQLRKNRLIQKYQNLGIKEQLFSDTTDAVGHLQDQITKSAYPNFIGRKIITTASTNEAVERFPLDSKAVAYSYAEGSATRLSGTKNHTVTIKMDEYAEYAEQWTNEFIEDATQNTINNIIEKAGKALGENETKTVIDLYGNIEDQDLAGGEVLDQGNRIMNWNAVLALHNVVRCENWRPNVLLLNDEQLGQLLLDNKFIEQEYLPSSEVDLESPGLIRKIVGMKVEASTLVPNGTAYAIDTRTAGIMLIRRDVTIDDYSDPMTKKYGIRASTRFGLGILRSNAVAKMTNIKKLI